MPPFQHCYLFAHLAGEMESNSKKVRRGAFKSKREGYALYKAGHVQKVKFNHTTDEHFCFFESRVKASMTRNKLYRTRVSLSKQTAQVKSGACNCKAGANGRCKHIGALLYKILDFTESEVNEIPPDLTCTERPQQWHIPHSNSSKDELVLLDDLLVIKHNYEADKTRKKNVVRTQRKVEKQMYDAAPSFARKINEHQIKQFSEDLKAAKTKNRPMLIDLLEGNECKPIVTQDITLRENRDNILKDHDYCCHSNGKRQNEMGHADSGIDIPCKIIKMESVIEPLDANFDNRFCLSHCEAVQVDADSERSVTEDDDQEYTQSLPPEKPCINTSFSYTEKHAISEWTFTESFPDDYDLNEENFRKVCTDFVGKLSITETEISEIEIQTRGQSENTQWFKYRCARVTASKFGEIKNRRSTTAPDRLIHDIFQYNPKGKTPHQCQEGLRLEPIIKEKYVAKQLETGHTGIKVSEKGLIIDRKSPLLAASIDGEVYDPTAKHSPVGNLEMKYKQFPRRLCTQQKIEDNLLHFIAKHAKDSCLQITSNGLKLKTRHHYYAQIQGGMGISGRQWCDLAVYCYYGNMEDLHIERIYFDPIYWNDLKRNLLDFCLHAVVPEIITKRIKRGKPLHPTVYCYKK